MTSTPSSPLPINQQNPLQPSSNPKPLNLNPLPPIFVSATHFDPTSLHALEDSLVECGAALTYDLNEAGIVLSKVARKPRVLFDLKARGAWTEEVEGEVLGSRTVGDGKEVKIDGTERDDVIVIDDDHDDSSTASEGEVEGAQEVGASNRPPAKRARTTAKATVIPSDSLIIVVKVEWFEESRRAGEPLPLQQFLTYQGRRVAKSVSATPNTSTQTTPKKATHFSKLSSQPIERLASPTTSILERAKEDAQAHPPRTDRFGKRKFNQTTSPPHGTATWESKSRTQPPAHLLQKTTSEDATGVSSDLPPPPPLGKSRR